MKRLAPLLVAFLAVGLTLASVAGAEGPCRSVDDLNLYDPDRPGVRFTTPPYVALAASGGLRRLAHRTRPLRHEIALTPEQVACLQDLTETRLTAVRAGSSYRYKLQTATATLLLFHVADLAGSEAMTPSQVERLLANAERFLNEGNRTEAARAYREVLKAGPRPSEAAAAHTALGRIAKGEGGLDIALAHFRMAVEADPRSIPALEERADLAMELEYDEEARQSYEELVKLVPGRPGPYSALIQIAWEENNNEEMARLFRKLQAVDQQAAERLAYEIPSLRPLRRGRKHVAPGKDVLEIPLTSHPDGTLTAEVSVNGSEPMSFIVDTGASLVSLKGATANRLGIEIDPKRKGILRTAKGTREAPLITIERMEIKGIEARAVKGVILEQDFGGGVEGLLGQSFLNQINARIDIVKKVMIIEG